MTRPAAKATMATATSAAADATTDGKSAAPKRDASLSSLQLDAFAEVARTGSFSQAASALHITQSALSQRILNLESELGSTLFIREPGGARVTELGQKLLRFCQSKSALENEFRDELRPGAPGELAGRVRIGGYSTVVRSVVIPTMRELLAKNTRVQLELLTRETQELPRLLETGQADFIFLDRAPERSGLVSFALGQEEYVLVQPRGKKSVPDIYLDNDENDRTTESFFALQGKATNLRHAYFNEIYAIIDGVLAGLGRAVVPLHIARDYPGLEIVKGHKPLRIPVYFCYYEQAFYTKLQKAVIDRIRDAAPANLEK